MATYNTFDDALRHVDGLDPSATSYYLQVNNGDLIEAYCGQDSEEVRSRLVEWYDRNPDANTEYFLQLFKGKLPATPSTRNAKHLSRFSFKIKQSPYGVITGNNSSTNVEKRAQELADMQLMKQEIEDLKQEVKEAQDGDMITRVICGIAEKFAPTILNQTPNKAVSGVITEKETKEPKTINTAIERLKSLYPDKDLGGLLNTLADKLETTPHLINLL